MPTYRLSLRSRRPPSFQKDQSSVKFARASFANEMTFDIAEIETWPEASWTINYLRLASLLPILSPRKNFYPRLVRLFYESIRRKRGSIHSDYTISIDGHKFDINAKVIADALGIPSSIPSDCPLQKLKIPSDITEVIQNFKTFAPGDNFSVDRYDLPEYLLFFDTVIQRNIFSNGYENKRFGTELQILYAADYSQWFSPADFIVNTFFPLSQAIKQGKTNRIQLQYPFLISTVLLHIGLPISDDEPTACSPIEYTAWIWKTNLLYLEKAKKKAKKEDDSIDDIVFD